MNPATSQQPSLTKRLLSGLMAVGLVSALLTIVAPAASADAIVTKSFLYSGGTETFTVPEGVTSIGVAIVGGQGGQGGKDAAGPSPAGGFVGQVQGTITVTSGQVLTAAVGSGGTSGSGGNSASAAGVGGSNPLAGYDGAGGGAPGSGGSSGGGGGSGAASVLQLGGLDLVAGGGGGSGGSGQFAPIIGRLAEDHFVARSDAPSSTSGRPGLSANEACNGSCDGGGSGAGGGGAQGGEHGADQYGGEDATEWFGFGGFPGSNSDAGVSGLTTIYQYVTGNNSHGSISLTYSVGVPDPPRSVVGAPGNGIIDVYWLAPLSPGSSPIIDYVVKYSTNPNGPFTTFNDGVSTDRRSTITGLTNGTSYYLQVLAVNVVGESLPSSVSTFPTVPTATPDPKPILLYATSGDASAALEWSDLSSPGATVTDYQIEYATNSGGPWTTFAHAPSTAQTSTVTGLANGTPYLFRVVAVTTVGQEPFSNAASATPLGAPTAPTITSISPLSSALRVSFNPPSNNGGSAVTGYQYQLDGGTWVTVPQTSTPLIIGGLTNGTEYSVALRALTASSAGAPSVPMTGTPYGLPGMVPGFSAAPGTSSVTLNWDAASSNGTPVTSYNVIQWNTLTAGSIITSQLVPGSDRTVTLTGLSAGLKYFTVEAVNIAGTGPRTPTRVTAQVGGTVPAAPTFTDVAVDQSNVSLTWSHGAAGSSAITGYIVRYIDESNAATTLKLSATAGTSAGLTLPSPTAPYRLEVAEVSAAGTGVFATVRPPIVETGAATLTVSGKDATLTGDANANGEATTFQFELAENAADLGTAAATLLDPDIAADSSKNPVVLSLTTSGLKTGTTYYYRALATSGGWTAVGSTNSFTTQTLIAVTDLSKTYDGQPIEVITSTDPTGLAVASVYTGVSGTTYGPTSTPPAEAGDYSLTSSITSAGYNGSRTDAVTIARAAQTVTIDHVGLAAKAGETVTPEALSSAAGLTSTLSIISGEGTICVLSGGSLKFIGAGNCVFQATQVGTRNYAPTTTVMTIEVSGSIVSDPSPTKPDDDNTAKDPGGSVPSDSSKPGGTKTDDSAKDGSNADGQQDDDAGSDGNTTPDHRRTTADSGTKTKNLAFTGGSSPWLVFSGVALLGWGLSLACVDRRRGRRAARRVV